MSDLWATRAQMGTSLAFHIDFSVLGVGLPLLLCSAKGLALQWKDMIWMMLTRRWTRTAVVLFVILVFFMEGWVVSDQELGRPVVLIRVR